jgi:hypothetical protein
MILTLRPTCFKSKGLKICRRSKSRRVYAENKIVHVKITKYMKTRAPVDILEPHGTRARNSHLRIIQSIQCMKKKSGTFVACSTALKQLPPLQCLNQHQSDSHQELEIPNASRLSNKDNNE